MFNYELAVTLPTSAEPFGLVRLPQYGTFEHLDAVIDLLQIDHPKEMVLTTVEVERFPDRKFQVWYAPRSRGGFIRNEAATCLVLNKGTKTETAVGESAATQAVFGPAIVFQGFDPVAPSDILSRVGGTE